VPGQLDPTRAADRRPSGTRSRDRRLPPRRLIAVHRVSLAAAFTAAVAAALFAQGPSTSSSEADAAKAVKDVAALWHQRKFDDALLKVVRVQDEYAMTAAAPEAGLWAGRTLVALGDPIAAMEELQLIRSRWPRAATAGVALAQNAILRRLYVRPVDAPAYGAPEKVGPDKLETMTSVVVTAHGAVFRAGDRTADTVQAAEGDRLPSGPFTRPRVALDTDGNVVLIDGGRLIPTPPAKPFALTMPRAGKGSQPLEKVESVAQLSSGEWLVVDSDDKTIQKFSRQGEFLGPFETAPGKDGPMRVSRLAVNAFDEVAALSDSESRVVLFESGGAVKGSIPYKRRTQDFRDSQDVAYELKDPRDLAFDVFGHLYVLDTKAVAIFSPYAAPVLRAPSARPTTAAPNRGDDYRLRALFAEIPEKTREGFRATAFALDRAGAIYLYDETLKQMLVYR
jgi:hypothetical protein